MEEASSAISELHELGLTATIDEITATRIKGELFIIDGLYRQGAYRENSGFLSDRIFYAAYNAIAQEIIRADTPSEVIDRIIPLVVLKFSEKQHWRRYVLNLERMQTYLRGPINEWHGRRLLMQAEAGGELRRRKRFPRRAAWLKERLKERGWDHNDPIRHNGPDRKTVLKILHSDGVREDVLEKLALALNCKTSKVSLADIPSD
jgi:hypothetical protein